MVISNVLIGGLHLHAAWFARLLPAVAVLPLYVGCNSQRCPIEGEVTLDARAVEEGTISLEPADGKGPTTGGKIAAGTYQIRGDAAPLPGKKIVRIFAVRKTGRKVVDEFGPPGAMIDDVEPYVPDIYNARSTLTCEVSRDGPSRIDFHLKSPRK